MKRSGFTMVELIFVIVILGILAAVAIPKLAATRDDAKASSVATNIATAMEEIAAEYTSKGKFSDSNLSKISNAVLSLEGSKNSFNESNVSYIGGFDGTVPSSGTHCLRIKLNPYNGLDSNSSWVAIIHSTSDTTQACTVLKQLTKEQNVTIGGSGVTY